MARVTVEDCLGGVENIFQLVLVATKRARQLSNGAAPHLPEENDKPTVIALREVAEGAVGPDILGEPDDPIAAAEEERRQAEAVARARESDNSAENSAE